MGDYKIDMCEECKKRVGHWYYGRQLTGPVLCYHRHQEIKKTHNNNIDAKNNKTKPIQSCAI